MLLAEAGAPDPEAAVDAALAPLSPEVYEYTRHTLGHSKDRITASLTWLARRLTGD
ncbi:hypothetical protein [Thermocatellispora tengchongensis]|uniref:hypothetical protein n=1 Tax=Thermocatellispora tengchongensis TaxID=1073253 RepID=UPI0036304FE6